MGGAYHIGLSGAPVIIPLVERLGDVPAIDDRKQRRPQSKPAASTPIARATAIAGWLASTRACGYLAMERLKAAAEDRSAEAKSQAESESPQETQSPDGSILLPE